MGWIRVKRTLARRSDLGRPVKFRVHDHWRWQHPHSAMWAHIQPSIRGDGYDWAVGSGAGNPAWQAGWASASNGQTVRDVVFPVVRAVLAVYVPYLFKRRAGK